MLGYLLAVAEEAGAGTAEAAEKSLEVLPDPAELIFGTLFFFILVLALVKFVFPKLNEALAKRTAAIQGQMEEAERVKRDADQVLEQYRAQLAEARAEVQKIIEDGRRTAEALKADIVAKAEQQAQDIVARAQSDVAGERDRAVQQLRGTLAELSIDIAGRVIEKELTSSDAHRALVDRAIADLAGATNGSGGGQQS